MPHWSCTRRATTPVTTSRTSTGPWSETGWPSTSAQMPERAPKFTAHEMARRWSLARDLMRRHDLGALVVFGTSGVNRHNQANVFWLTNHLDLHHTYLVAPCEGSVEPVLYVGLLNHVPAARETSEVPVAGVASDVREGMPEYVLLAIIEGASRAAGGQPHIAFLRSMPMDNPTGCVPAQNPSGRRIRRGDVIITEISASCWGYSGQIHRPVFVGADPTPSWRRMFETAYEAYQRMAGAVRPGAAVREIIRAASVIGERGYRIYDDLVHGYGVDIHPPVIDRSCCDYWPWDEARPAPEGRCVEQNMAIVIQPNPVTPDQRMGLQLGALTVVTDSGAECLHGIPFEPLLARG